MHSESNLGPFVLAFSGSKVILLKIECVNEINETKTSDLY